MIMLMMISPEREARVGGAHARGAHDALELARGRAARCGRATLQLRMKGDGLCETGA